MKNTLWYNTFQKKDGGATCNNHKQSLHSTSVTGGTCPSFAFLSL